MIRIRQIKIPIELDSYDYLTKKIQKLLFKAKIEEIIIKKKSIDARSKDIFYIYEVNVKTKMKKN